MNTDPDRVDCPIGILKLNALVNLREPNMSYHTVMLAPVRNLTRR